MIQAVKHSLLTRVPGVQKLRIEPAYDSGVVSTSKEDIVYTFSVDENLYVHREWDVYDTSGPAYVHTRGECWLHGEFTIDAETGTGSTIDVGVPVLYFKAGGTSGRPSDGHLYETSIQFEPDTPPSSLHAMFRAIVRGFTYNLDDVRVDELAVSFDPAPNTLRLQIPWLEIEYREFGGLWRYGY